MASYPYKRREGEQGSQCARKRTVSGSALANIYLVMWPAYNTWAPLASLPLLVVIISYLQLSRHRTIVSQACYTASDSRRNSRLVLLYLQFSTGYRFPLFLGDTRTVMAHQLDTDPAPQRKRAAVAVRRPCPTTTLVARFEPPFRLYISPRLASPRCLDQKFIASVQSADQTWLCS